MALARCRCCCSWSSMASSIGKSEIRSQAFSPFCFLLLLALFAVAAAASTPRSPCSVVVCSSCRESGKVLLREKRERRSEKAFFPSVFSREFVIEAGGEGEKKENRAEISLFFTRSSASRALCLSLPVSLSCFNPALSFSLKPFSQLRIPGSVRRIHQARN